jgi:hypothetical protein
VLKQRVRDHIDPDKDLGHSDTHGKKKKTIDEGKGEESAITKSVESADTKSAGTASVEGGDTKSTATSAESADTKSVVTSVESADTKTVENPDVKRNPDGTVCEDCK